MLRELGTVAFDLAHMRATIGMGGLVQDDDCRVRIVPELDPTRLQLGIWLATVPEEYRHVAEMTARNVVQLWMLDAMTPRRLEQFVEELSCECVRAVRHYKRTGGIVILTYPRR